MKQSILLSFITTITFFCAGFVFKTFLDISGEASSYNRSSGDRTWEHAKYVFISEGSSDTGWKIQITSEMPKSCDSTSKQESLIWYHHPGKSRISGDFYRCDSKTNTYLLLTTEPKPPKVYGKFTKINPNPDPVIPLKTPESFYSLTPQVHQVVTISNN